MKTNKTNLQSGKLSLLLLLLLMIIAAPTMAQNRGQISFKFVNKTGQDATDLHIDFKNQAKKLADPQHPGDATYQEPHGIFKHGQGDGGNHWDLAAGNGNGVEKDSAVTLYFEFTGNAPPEVKRYTWTNDNDLNPKTGIIKTKQNRKGVYKYTCADQSAGDGFTELTVANETFTFNYPPGLTDTEMALTFADFIENEVEFLHVSSIDENVITIHSSYLSEDLDNFTNNIQQDSLMATEFKYDPEYIPTLTEWGVIILLLLVLAIGVVFIYQRQTSMAMAGVTMSANAKPKLFDRKLFAKVFAVLLLLGIAGLVTAYLYYGSITNADPFGTFVSAAIVAYMAHLWLLKKPTD